MYAIRSYYAQAIGIREAQPRRGMAQQQGAGIESPTDSAQLTSLPGHQGHLALPEGTADATQAKARRITSYNVCYTKLLRSWMGGDRDGNPFVTSTVTREVLTLSRWVAVSLFLKDIQELVSELSMIDCSERLRERVGECNEPYRELLRGLRDALKETLQHLTANLQGQYTEARDLITRTEQLREPLELCYHSLHECGMSIIAA